LNRIYLKRWLSWLAALWLIVWAILPVYAAPDGGGRVPYRYHLEKLNGYAAAGDMIHVIRDLPLARGDVLEAEGWLATDEGVSSYQYLWVPAGGGSALWQTPEGVEIFAREDLTRAGVDYRAGHGTAGFRFTITPPEGITDGLYDVYIRAIDGMGNACDLVALLDLRYGDPDVDNGSSRLISFPRIAQEGDASARGDVSLGETGVTLSGEGRVRLGEFNLTAFEMMRITYTAHTDLHAGMGEGRRSVLGLKSAGDHGYGMAGEAYNLTDSLAYAALAPGSGEGVLEIDLSHCFYFGDVWLTGYLGSEITVTSVELFYNGSVPSRVAAKIYLSEDLVGPYFSGMNYTDLKNASDPVLGDVLRMEVREETNDPFAFFHAGKLLADHGIVLDADEYKYLVLLYRAEQTVNSDRMNLYLCSGTISGATEDCNQGVSLQPDGAWHYLLVDLSQKANWGGVINGWRFDYISANSDPGDAVEFATAQFFRTAEAARHAAAQDPYEQSGFRRGDDPILRDMSEEDSADAADDVFVIPPEDAYVVTEPMTEAVTEPTAESHSSVPAPPTVPAETQPTKKGGCASVAPLSFMLILMATAPAFIRRED